MLTYFMRNWGLKEYTMDKVTYWKLERTSPCFHVIYTLQLQIQAFFTARDFITMTLLYCSILEGLRM